MMRGIFVFFFSSPCPISFIQMVWCHRTAAVTMADRFPGGRSAVALILSRGGERTARAANSRRCEALQILFIYLFPGVQRERVFSAHVAGSSSRDTGLCLQHLSDLLVMTVHTRTNTCILTQMHGTDRARRWDLPTGMSNTQVCKYEHFSKNNFFILWSTISFETHLI